MITHIREGLQVGFKNTWTWPIKDEGAWDWLQYEKDLPDRIMPYVKNKDCCITAGAHTGVYAYQYARIFNKVFAFEPHPVNFYCLSENVIEENVIKFQACLSNQRKMVGLHTEHIPNSGGYYVVPGNLCMTMLIDDIPVQPDLIHLDVEGHEFEALSGAINILSTSSPTIVIETIPNYSTEKAEKLLYSLGYKVAEKLRHDTIFVK
ncbi:FkbM family methyltransferase [bacterium]|nr:FkbM family methyltransferase [bacterium]